MATCGAGLCGESRQACVQARVGCGRRVGKGARTRAVHARARAGCLAAAAQGGAGVDAPVCVRSAPVGLTRTTGVLAKADAFATKSALPVAAPSERKNALDSLQVALSLFLPLFLPVSRFSLGFAAPGIGKCELRGREGENSGRLVGRPNREHMCLEREVWNQRARTTT